MSLQRGATKWLVYSRPALQCVATAWCYEVARVLPTYISFSLPNSLQLPNLVLQGAHNGIQVTIFAFSPSRVTVLTRRSASQSRASRGGATAKQQPLAATAGAQSTILTIWSS